MGIDPVSHKPKNDTHLSRDGQSKSVANLSHMAQWESARLEAEARLVKQSRFQCARPNEKQVRSVEPSLGSNRLFAPTRCCDILKAWNRVWGNKHNGVSGGNGIGDLESPTSTLSTTGVAESSNVFKFVGGNSSGSYDDRTECEEFDEEWECKDENEMANSISIFTGINMSSTDNNNEHMHCSKFLESFTDLPLSNPSTSNHRNVLTNADSNNSFEPNQVKKNYYEDNSKNYWNNILNLVNSSLQDPPLF